MTETPNEIMEEIEVYRSHLGEDLTALESRVRDATTWRTYYDRHPYLFVGTALGGGLLLSGLLSSKRGGNHFQEPHPSRYETVGHCKGGLAESLDEIKTALIDYGATKVKEAIGEILPGFAEHSK
jgi:hypothetical protein